MFEFFKYRHEIIIPRVYYWAPAPAHQRPTAIAARRPTPRHHNRHLPHPPRGSRETQVHRCSQHPHLRGDCSQLNKMSNRSCESRPAVPSLVGRVVATPTGETRSPQRYANGQPGRQAAVADFARWSLSVTWRSNLDACNHLRAVHVETKRSQASAKRGGALPRHRICPAHVRRHSPVL